MDRAQLRAALTALGARLAAKGLIGELYVVGGAAMALGYDARRTTKDVAAVFQPKMAIYRLAGEVAEELGLPPDWLNDGVKGLLLGDDPFTPRVFEVPGLRAQVASPQMLLVLKCLSHRPGADDDDVRYLAALLDLHRQEQVMELVVQVAGAQRVSPATQYFVQSLFPEDEA